jgi:type II secretory pathway pseudopilin PulG
VTHRHMLTLAVFAALAAPLAAAELPPDLAAVPADAHAVVTVRVGDLYRGELMRDVRALLLKAGPKALAALDSRMVPPPSSVERVTLVWKLADPATAQEPVVIIGTSKPFEKEGLFRSLVPGAEAGSAADTRTDAKTKLTVKALAPTAFAAGTTGKVEEFRFGGRQAESLRDALAGSAGKTVVGWVNVTAIPGVAQELANAPPAVRMWLPLLRARTGTANLTLGPKSTLDVRLDYADADDAGAALVTAKNGLQMARAGLAVGRQYFEGQLATPPAEGKSALERTGEAMVAVAALAGLREAGDTLNAMPLKQDGPALSASLAVPPVVNTYLTSAMPTMPVGIGLMLPAVQKVREAANRSRTQNNLKQIALAMQNHASAYNDRFPAANWSSKKAVEDKPMLSWRVAILPYLDEDNLYRRFKLDEPWDSPNNIKLLELMPNVYKSPQMPNVKAGHTYYQVLTGRDTPFPPDKVSRIPASFPDGTSNTILVVQGGKPVPWTKPEDIEYDAKTPLAAIVGPFTDFFMVALADGTVRSLNMKVVSEKTLRAAITPAGGETPDKDWDE